jgi:hypothetical protein
MRNRRTWQPYRQGDHFTDERGDEWVLVRFERLNTPFPPIWGVQRTAVLHAVGGDAELRLPADKLLLNGLKPIDP